MLFFCIKSASLYNLLSTKCAPSVPYADFADLVHKVFTKCAICRLCRLGAHSTQPQAVTGFLGWSVGQHMEATSTDPSICSHVDPTKTKAQ
jgi:hypothetical protein